MSTTVQDPLPDLLRTFQRKSAELGRHRLLSLLRAPAQESEVADLFAARGLVAPREILDFYGWHDGTEFDGETTDAQLWLLPPFVFPSVTQAAQEYDERMRSEAHWDPSWWPLLPDGGGGFLNAVCFAEANAVAPVVEYQGETNEEAVIHRSLQALLGTILTAIDEGVLTYDGDRGVELDYDRYYDDVAPRMNPGVPFWSDR